MWGRGTAGMGPAPAPRCRSLKRSGEDKEQRLALLEAARAAAEREVSELRAALRGLESARLENRRELQELRRQVKELDSENSRRGRELGELQARVALEEQREQRSRREASGLRQKVAESEAGTEAARKEVWESPKSHCGRPTSPSVPVRPRAGCPGAGGVPVPSGPACCPQS
ncbi:rootletin-like [Parus major]|uniref:rootletin-like n=1 Tax=Parus major TaxID=9157 RepID=UPI0007713C52|nr:rootletin-like [Parus major]